MSGHEDVLRHAAELEELAKAMLNKVDALRTAHCRAIMRQSSRDTASPRVVAGPVRFREHEPTCPHSEVGTCFCTPRILTHPACVAPCGPCMDEPPGAA